MSFEPTFGGVMDFGRIRFTNPISELMNIRDDEVVRTIGNRIIENMREEEFIIKEKYRQMGINPPVTSLDGSGSFVGMKKFINAMKDPVSMRRMLDQSKAAKQFLVGIPHQPQTLSSPPGPPQQMQPGAGVRPPQRSFRF